MLKGNTGMMKVIIGTLLFGLSTSDFASVSDPSIVPHSPKAGEQMKVDQITELL